MDLWSCSSVQVQKRSIASGDSEGAEVAEPRLHPDR